MALFGRKSRSSQNSLPALAQPEEVPFPEQVITALDKLNVDVRAKGRELPTFATSKIRSVEDRLRELFKYAQNTQFLPQDKVAIMNMIENHIPTSMESFLRLRAHERADAKVIEEIVTQFDIIHRSVKRFDEVVRSGNMDQVRIQSIFLDMGII